MKKFRIEASFVTYLTAEIEAENEEQAYEIARDMDGGDFEQRRWDGQGDWNIDDVTEIEG